MTTPSTPRALSIPEAAKALGIGKTTLYVLMNGHEIKSLKIGKKRRVIPVREIERYLDRAR